MPCPFCGTKENTCACTFSFAPARSERSVPPAGVAPAHGPSPAPAPEPEVEVATPEPVVAADTSVLLQFLRDFTSPGPAEAAQASGGPSAPAARAVRGPFGPGGPFIEQSGFDPVTPTFSWPFEAAGDMATPSTTLPPPPAGPGPSPAGTAPSAAGPAVAVHPDGPVPAEAGVPDLSAASLASTAVPPMPPPPALLRMARKRSDPAATSS